MKLKVFKFGGASVKDAAAVRNMVSIIEKQKNQHLMIVLSAMGKTTNGLEKLLLSAREKPFVYEASMEELKTFHFQIVEELFGEDKNIKTRLHSLFVALEADLIQNRSLAYDQYYDLIVPYGELLSTTIVAAYLEQSGLPVLLKDARKLVMTDSNFRAANVNWKLTQHCIESLKAEFETHSLILTQGFIGSNPQQQTTTLGREGSDFTAAIFAYCLDAQEVVIWKDVSGLLNADPKRFSQTVKLPSISYSEAIELAFYGATIIHPKTIKPLQNKQIKLKIQSFLDAEIPASIISNNNENDTLFPSFIVKDNQLLLSISPRDFSFMDEARLSFIFGTFQQLRIHTNLLQTSALSLSVCIDDNERSIQGILEAFSSDYFIKYNHNLRLLTVRHYTDAMIPQLVSGQVVLLEQRSRTTLQMVMEYGQG